MIQFIIGVVGDNMRGYHVVLVFGFVVVGVEVDLVKYFWLGMVVIDIV